MLSGCGKKESDDMFVLDQEEMSIQGEVQNSELGKKMKVPQSIDCKMKTEDADLQAILISDKSVCIPDVEQLYTMKCSRERLDASYKKKISEAIFGETVLYIYDGTPLISECDEQIQYCKNKQNISDTFYKQYYQASIEELEQQKKTAQEIREKNIDFSADQYIGMINDQKYLLTFYGNEDYCESFELMLYPENSMEKFFEIDNGYGFVQPTDILSENELLYSDLLNYSENEEDLSAGNRCSKTIEEAIDTALGYAGACVSLPVDTGCVEPFCVSYIKGETEEEVLLCDGYSITFLPKIEQVTPFVSDLYYVESIAGQYDNRNDSQSSIMTNGSILRIVISSKGVVGIGCVMPVKQDEKAKKVEQLLTWDEIMEALKNGLPEYIKKHGASYSQIAFNHVELTYYLEETEEGYCYIPVWLLANIDAQLQVPDQLILLDARNGRFVEIK